MFGRLKNWWNERRGRSIPQAHAPESIEEFAELLARSGITTVQQANDYVAQFRAEHPAEADSASAVTELCGFLTTGGRVTAWQCEKLQLGKWRGFYLDNYLFLEQVGKGGHDQSSYYSSYKARDTKDGNLVCVFVRPARYTKGGIEYRVKPYAE